MARPLHARIDLDALRHNLHYARELAGTARILAVIKANGYGHGAVRIAQALRGLGDAFGVACLEEALELRESGIRTPILLLEGVLSPDELPQVDRLDLSMVVHSLEQLRWIAEAHPSRPIACWIKLDTGMHRLGFSPAELPAVHAELTRAPQVGEVVLMTHFARADQPDHPCTPEQIARFTQACAGIHAPRSLSGSAGLLAWSEAVGDWVRPGILLYGASPLGDLHPSATRLRPVMHLESALIAVRDLAPGEPIGYGGRFCCDGPTRVGVVATGYADGYPRHAPDGTPVAVKGRLSRIIGRVSMDMLTLDLTGLGDIGVGDPVELWGAQVSANGVATASGTIAYELFTGIASRVPRVYTEPCAG
jgi:alanine racemase